MPHYKSGTLAAIGDIVRGKGYNIPHEIIGKVLEISEKSDNCNLTVACVTKESMILKNDVIGSPGMTIHYTEVRATIEYGQADQFEKIA
jgi:hypothetical protein